MKSASFIRRLLAGPITVTLAATLTVACGRVDRSKSDDGRGASARTGAVSNEKYPGPRWPSYFKPPKSVDDLMPAARLLVRNPSGLQGKGLGILQAGESVMIVASNDADPMVLDAITRALHERKITPHIKMTYELMQDKFLGTFITDNIYNLQSLMSSYPGDVWQLAEEQLLEPTLLKTGATTPERIRSGVIHWGLGIRLWHDPDAPTESKKWREFTEEHNIP